MKLRAGASAFAAVLVTVVCAGPAAAAAVQPSRPRAVSTATPIKHFIFLMQGGRTFDNYFGTFPGANGVTLPAASDPAWSTAILVQSSGNGRILSASEK